MLYNQQVEAYYSDVSTQFALLKKYNTQSDLYLSNQFNVFDFIRPDENKLSYIISDLLDPQGNHGQGNTFLNEFLLLIELEKNENLGQIVPAIYREKSTHLIKSTQRRIDILIDWQKFGILIENKPWALDQDLQLEDYSQYMKRYYGENFLIIYLTKENKSPSEDSISNANLNILKSQGQYKEMVFTHGFKIWIRNCINICQSDKFRWFLRDFVNYLDYNL